MNERISGWEIQPCKNNTLVFAYASLIRVGEKSILADTTLRNINRLLLHRSFYSTSHFSLSWSKDLIEPKIVPWNALLLPISNIILNHWRRLLEFYLHPNKEFSVATYYLALIHCDIQNINKNCESSKCHSKSRFSLYIRVLY